MYKRQLPLDRNDPVNWRASMTPGGNPGALDATSFTGSPTADADGDGASAFLEYALGTSDTAPTSSPVTAPVSLDQTGMIFTFARRLSADDVAYAIESSADLLTWNRATSELLSRTQNDEVVTEAHRIVPASPAPSRLFVRVRATPR